MDDVIIVLACFAPFAWHLARNGRLGRRGARLAAIGLGFAFCFFALGHVAIHAQLVRMLPDWVPARGAIIYATGVLEILIAVGLFSPSWQRLAGRAAMCTLVLFFPANVYAAFAGTWDVPGQEGPDYLWIRGPLQLFLFVSFGPHGRLSHRRRYARLIGDLASPMPERADALSRPPSPRPFSTIKRFLECLIRSLEPRDSDQWLRVWEGYNRFYGRSGITALSSDIARMTWARFFDPYEPVNAIVAESRGSFWPAHTTIFYRSTTAIEPSFYLQDLFTRDDARGKGIGKALIN